MDTSMTSEDQIYSDNSETRDIVERLMLHDAAEEVCETTSEENTPEATNESPQKQQHLKSNDANKHEEPEGFNNRIEAIVDQRDHLLQISFRREREIECLKAEKQLLEKQLQSAVKAKSEAIARLDLIEGKELNLSFKEKDMEMDKERLHNQVENLTDDLNTNRTELMAVRQDYLWATSQLEIDSNKYAEQIRLANSSICQLTETNQMLEGQKEDYAIKLTEQIDEASKVMALYDSDLKAKVELVDLYKANCDDHQAHINELETAVTELKQLVNESADECGILVTELSTNQIKLDAKDEIIAKLRQELKDANYLLSSDENASDNQMDTEPDRDILDDISLTDLDHIRLNKGATMTEMYNKYCIVVQELQSKQKELDEVKTEAKNVIEGVQESAKKFKLQELDNQMLKADNEGLIEEKKNLIVEKVVTRVKLEDTLIRYDLLEKENKRLEMCASQKKSPEKNAKSDVQDSRDSQYLSTELKEQNDTLLQLVRELFTKIEEMEVAETKSNSEIRELRDANENLLANRQKVNASSTNVSHKSVAVTENQLMIENYSSILTPKKDVQRIEDKLQDKMKELQELKQEYDALVYEKRELTVEKIKLSSELNVSNIQNNGHSEKILSLEEQKKMYVNTISEHKIAIKCLTDEKINCNQKLSTVESRLEHLHEECRKLSGAKTSLEIEVETLKKELLQAKMSIQILESESKIAGDLVKRLETQTQRKMEEKDTQMQIERSKLQNELDRCNNIIAGMERNSTNDISNNIEETEHENSEIENQVPVTFEIQTLEDDFQTNKYNFLNSLRLEKTTKEEKSKSSSSSKVVDFKRLKRSRNDEECTSAVVPCHMTLRSQKRARVSFKTYTKRDVGLALADTARRVIKVEHEDDEEDEDDEEVEDAEVNLYDGSDEEYKPEQESDSDNIESELRNEIRTRSQAQFLHDALHSEIKESQTVPCIGKPDRPKIKTEPVVVDQQNSERPKRQTSIGVRGKLHSTRSQTSIRGRGETTVVSLSETSVRGRGRSSGVGRGRSSGGGRGRTSVRGRGRSSGVGQRRTF